MNTIKTSVRHLIGVTLFTSSFSLVAHDWHSHDAVDEPVAQVAFVNAVAGEQNSSDKLITKAFGKFSSTVKTHSDNQCFYVVSNGMPDHKMMVGITAWQQQVPLPQAYIGANAWQIPMLPIPAKNKLSAKTGFFRGAIAIAVNGVPIFNPIKNDGRTDTFLAGELDLFGGHAGRADDYHYHIAPLHLQETVGHELPIAFALDGYAIYGLIEPDGSGAGRLDELNGHIGSDGLYHYHSSKKYPYINGGFHGEVTVRGGQVDPQPRSRSPRPATSPLRGAKITGWNQPASNHYSLTYQLGREYHQVNYTILETGSVRFDYVDGSGRSITREYQPGSDARSRQRKPPPGNR